MLLNIGKKIYEANEQNIRFELQLWYSASAEKRDTSFRRVSTIVESLNGRCLVHSVIEEISYHSILVEFAINCYTGYYQYPRHSVGEM